MTKTQRWGYPMNPKAVVFREANPNVFAVGSGPTWQSSGGREAAFARGKTSTTPEEAGPRKSEESELFKDRSMERCYAGCRKLAADPTSDFWYKGQRHTGAAHRNAYWWGLDGHASKYQRNSLAYACWAAGRDDRKEALKKERRVAQVDKIIDQRMIKNDLAARRERAGVK